MKTIIVERNSLTEYRSNNVCIMFAVRAGKEWALMDNNNGLLAPFVTFAKTKKELEKSFMFEMVKELYK